RRPRARRPAQGRRGGEGRGPRDRGRRTRRRSGTGPRRRAAARAAGGDAVGAPRTGRIIRGGEMTDTIAPVAAPFTDKWARASATPTVEAYHTAIRKLVAERFAASGKTWEEFVHDPELALTRADFEKVEADLLATGYKFEISAIVSATEDPDKYKPLESSG